LEEGSQQIREHRLMQLREIEGKPHLTACCSTGVAMPRGPLDLAIETARIKWQDWIALGGRIIVHRECCQWQHNVALSGSIPLQPANNP